MCTVNVNGYCYRYACIAMSCFDLYLAERLDNESIPAIMSVVPVSLLTNMHLSLSLPFLLHIPFSLILLIPMHALSQSFLKVYRSHYTTLKYASSYA